jgi:hypothetical protein
MADRDTTTPPDALLARAENSLGAMKDHLETLYAMADFLQDTNLSGSTMPDPITDAKEIRVSLLIDSIQNETADAIQHFEGYISDIEAVFAVARNTAISPATRSEGEI